MPLFLLLAVAACAAPLDAEEREQVAPGTAGTSMTGCDVASGAASGVARGTSGATGTGGARDGSDATENVGGAPSDDKELDNTTLVQELRSDLAINEIHYSYVEVYFTGTFRSVVPTDGLAIIVNDGWATPCVLDGAILAESSRYLVVQPPDLDCLPGNTCIFCELRVAPYDTVKLMLDVGGVWEPIDEQVADYPALSGGESLQADPNGSDNFRRIEPYTPGAAN